MSAAAGKGSLSPIGPTKKLAPPGGFREQEGDRHRNGDMDHPREVVSEVLDDVAEAEQRLRRAEAKMADSGLSEREGYREIAEFIGAALRNVRVASDASTRIHCTSATELMARVGYWGAPPCLGGGIVLAPR